MDNIALALLKHTHKSSTSGIWEVECPPGCPAFITINDDEETDIAQVFTGEENIVVEASRYNGVSPEQQELNAHAIVALHNNADDLITMAEKCLRYEKVLKEIAYDTEPTELACDIARGALE